MEKPIKTAQCCKLFRNIKADFNDNDVIVIDTVGM